MDSATDFNYLCTYDLYSPERNLFNAGRYITWASGRGLGSVKNGIEPIGECHLGPKKLKISRAQPPPTCPRNVSARIKNFMHRDV
jgi:hypothetical protein